MLKTNKFLIKLVASDNTFLINNVIAIIKNICKDSQKIFVMYEKFDKKVNFLKYPFDSSFLKFLLCLI